MQILSGPWHWSVSGLLIALIMFLLLYAGKQFGFSANLRTLCSVAGAGKRHAFFDFDWRAQRWNLTFALGAILGGFLATYAFPNPDPVQLSAATLAWLERIGLAAPTTAGSSHGFLPPELFNLAELLTVRGLIIAVAGGFLIGFGTRWAGGCTSGHAISGLANLQLPSLIAVVGFFIGGLVMTWGLLPLIIQL